MKKIILIFSVLLLTVACKKDYTGYHNITVDASCGQCMFKMDGKGCNLAVKIGEEYYYVEGTAIDDHGDVHADDGFCNAIKKATLSGNLADGKIKVSSFKLLEVVN